MKTFKNTVEVEYYPDAGDIADAFWDMCDEEQCYFFDRLYKIAGHKLAFQMQNVIDSEFFTLEAKMAMSIIGDYSKELEKGGKQMNELKELLTVKRHRTNGLVCPTALEMIRCGIGGNYGGEYYEEIINLVLKPIEDEIRKLEKREKQTNELPKNKEELIEMLQEAYYAGTERSRYAPESLKSSFLWWYKNKDKDNE